MNGEVNGSMQEPMETTAPHSPAEDVKSTNSAPETDSIETLKNNCNDSNDGDNLDSDDNQDECENSETDDSKYATNDNEEKQSVPTNENSNNVDSENPCSNSNDSYSNTVNSPKSASNDSQKDTQDVTYNEQSQDSSQSKTNKSEKPVCENTDEEDDDDDEEGSDDQARDVVSINSDSENDPDQYLSNSDIVLVEGDDSSTKQNGKSNKARTSEVHEIASDNDDCVVTGDEKNELNVSNGQPELRRSTRNRKSCRENLQNGNDESDVEVVDCEDPLNPDRRASNKKNLKQSPVKRLKGNNHQSSRHTVMLVDTNSILAGKDQHLQKTKSNSINSMSAQSLCQSIAARGTTVTPISSKTNPAAQLPQPLVKARSATPPPILPSLTDDMFVVEAPSFIVPYVYEKPSMKPFREFVDTLGKEIDEQKAKEEQERLEKEKLSKEKKEKEKQERRERGETVEDSDTEEDKSQSSAEVTQKKEEKKQRRRRKNDDDDASWDGESTSSCDDDVPSDEDNATQIIKEKDDSLDGIKDVTSDLTANKPSGSSDSYFDCSLGKFFMDIGLNLVQEYVQTDLLKQQTRKLQREKRAGHSVAETESSIVALTKNIELSKENNAPYKYKQSKCEFCSFKSESDIVLSHHLETPHMKNNVYKCNFCDFEIRSPHEILFHMEGEHKIRGKLERVPSYHQCPNCPFEDNGKGKLARHQLSCAKKFKPEINLGPPLDWEPPAKIPKITKPRNNVMSGYQSAFNRAQMNTNAARATANMMNMFKSRIRPPFPTVPTRPLMRSNPLMRPTMPTAPNMLHMNAANNIKKMNHQPSISITPLPRGQQPQLAVPQAAQSSLQGGKGMFVICEICDGYIKDLEQLRNHMQWIHKVKIHPKMIYNRPPLNCQKCQFRFFTDQGLERHLLGSHGLVTSSMQEAANKGKDAGRCPVCGKVYQWKLLNHVARDHNLTLKPAHLSYKCTVCTATFGMYKQFESHVYSAHRVVAKRVMDKSKTPPAKTNESALKPLKINDEITIIPQPAKTAATTSKTK